MVKRKQEPVRWGGKRPKYTRTIQPERLHGTTVLVGRGGIKNRALAKNRQLLPRVVTVPRPMKEVKYIEHTASSAEITSVGTWTCLSNCAVGDTETTRDGNTIRLIQAEVLYYMDISGDVDTYCRTIVLSDDQSPGVAPTAGELLTGTPTQIALYDVGIPARTRFRVLYDKVLHWPSSNEPSGSDRNLQLQRFKLNLDQLCHYDGSTVDTFRSGNIWLFQQSNKSTSANSPNVSFNTRIAFVDV